MTTLDAHLPAGRGHDAAAVAARVQAMAAAGVRIADELARAALIGQLGTTGDTNVQGEKVKKLDLLGQRRRRGGAGRDRTRVYPGVGGDEGDPAQPGALHG